VSTLKLGASLPHGAGLYFSAHVPEFIGGMSGDISSRYEAPMPRYFFHFSDGKHTFTDAAGVELNGIAAARAYATAQIRELRGAKSERALQNWAPWKMIVIDAKGKTIVEVGFDLSTRSMP
jgi:hypothetical protein